MSTSEHKRYRKKCCVPSCEDRKSSQHRFPKDDPAVFDVWLKNINNKELFNVPHETIYCNSRVCDRHFAVEDKITSRRGLKRHAVPVLFLPETIEEPRGIARMSRSSVAGQEQYEDMCQPSTSIPEQEICFGTPSRNEIISVTQGHGSCDNSYINQPSTSTFEQEQESHFRTPTRNRISVTQGYKTKKSVLRDLKVGRQSLLTPRAKHLYGRVIDSSKKLARLSRQLRTYQEKLHAAKKLSDSVNFQNLVKHINTLTYTFILSQIRSQKLVPKSRRFTTDEKILSLTLMKASGKGYRLLSKIFALPSKRTLTNLLNKIPIKPGINKRMFESLKNNVAKMKEIDKTCIVIFDEMSISSYLHYIQKGDFIEGLEDFGNERFPALADHVNVFMVKGVYRQWKQPICFTFSNGPTNSLRLKNMIKEVILECQEVGLNVVATVCDQGGPNKSSINQLQKDTREEFLREGKEKTCFGYCINGKEVVPLYDVPHLFKGIRNNLLTKDLHYRMKDKPGIAKWEHIEQFYFLDYKEPLRICPKLMDEHVIKDRIKKMKVKNCTQVFSYQVGSLMKKIVEWKVQVDLAPEAADTGEVILFLDKLFDSLNSSQKTAPAIKPLKGGLMKESGHEKFWRDSLQILNSMKFFSNKKQKFVSTPSITNLKHTISLDV
ncbi:uncharacterized protein [Leptinotarsa decemlineata]|uniref:uncharacterized protein n=1 Tax=Leptinotarsa decemlineata TaxID=7539 RepID=UPI003D3042EE